PPPLLLLIAIAFSYGVSLLFPGLQFGGSSTNLLGFLLIGIGAWLFLWAKKSLTKHKTTLRPRGKPSSLISTGPYGISRNPIYLGFLLISIGTALLFANVLAFVGPIIFFIFISTFVIPLEEDMLTRVFGASYKSYRQSIRRWI
ncbi:MAG TPA: isoprenylcysteine carboxylmethyltransferase family protein, partial [Patescibacteria group bacterium]|nr:isoprenylcysteine carboxylmethyltransferase family protein [Patescibacteria group bacterium]